jgi:truncated hemoglobin YjbI/chromosome segregation ATPase
MRKSSITLQHNKDVAVHYFYHNSREKPTANSIFKDNNNFTNRTATETLKTFWREFNIRKLKYEKEKNKKLPKNTIKHISGIFNLNEKHTKEDVKKVIEYLEETLDTKVVQYSIHSDEGYVDENGNKKVNYHAHLEMLGIDSNGRSIRKKITRQFLRELQTNVANILKMERGQDIKKTKKKRLDTYEYKKHIKLQNEETNKLKKEIEKLKEENNNLKQENQKLTQKEKKYENDVELLKNKNNENMKEIEQIKKENKELKEQIKKEKETLKRLREIMILINKKIKLYNKEDYKEISNIKQQLKELTNNSKLLTAMDNNIDKLIDHFIVKLDKQNETTKELYEYLDELEKLKKTPQQKRKYNNSFKM